MIKIAVLIANGSEEIEALTPVDVFRRCDDVESDLISVSGKNLICSHGVKVTADKVVEEIDFTEYDALVIPGGMPGATNISNTEKVIEAIKLMTKQDKLIASICASPAVVLASNNLLGSKKATCYPAPAFVQLMGENYTGNDVEVCDRLITANGPKSAFKFALAICESLGIVPKF